MTRSMTLSLVLLILSAFIAADAGFAQQPPDPRLALVIGESAYQPTALATAANDAGLVANTLSEAGFEVIGARDLDQDSLRKSLREFLDKAAAAGPNSIVLVYFAGYGLQLEGENFLVPVGARITRDADVSIEALRLSDFSRSLAAIPLKARIIVLDGAHAGPFAKSGPPLASGLALVEPDAATLIAFNAAPGTVAPAEAGPYSVYAQALTEMMRDGGLPLGDVFARTRLRVSEKTKGAVVPWDANKIEQPFSFFDRAADAPPVSPAQTAALQNKPLRELGPEEAYGLAVERDTITAYEDFLTAFPDHPLARRVRAMLAARRESITWRRTVSGNTPNAYWTYLKRYPSGPHAADARRRLGRLTAPLVPPPVFDSFDFDVPPPPPEEYVIVDRPVLIFDDFDYGPPPPLPVYMLPPPPPDWVVLPPPPPPPAPFYLPIPVPIPIPVWSRPPRPPLITPPVANQAGAGRPLPPPVVPVGAGFIQPPQAIISRPPTTVRPTNLPNQPGLRTNPVNQTPAATTPGAAAGTGPANSVVPNANAPQLLPIKPGQNGAQPNRIPGNRLPAAPGTTPGNNAQTPATPNLGVGGLTPQQLREQQLLQRKQQLEEQKAQQQQLHQQKLEQQKTQQQNPQLQQLHRQPLEQNKPQQPQQIQQQRQQQQSHQPEIQQIQKHQQIQQPQVRQPQIQQPQVRQPQIPQPQVRQPQIRTQEQAHQPARPTCGQPGLPVCPR